MEFFPEQARARLSIGELASFSLTGTGGRPGTAGLWRTRLGQQWHEALREPGAAPAGTRFEVAVEGSLHWKDWQIDLQGRIDQLRDEEGRTCIREVKTTLDALPVPDEDLMAAHPGYLAQLGAYLRLWRNAHPESAAPPAGELHFIDASSGISQILRPDPETTAAALDARLDELVAFLDARGAALARLRELPPPAAFPSLRPGQQGVADRLLAAIESHRTVLFQAPTGFGKTGLVLEAALESLRRGLFRRIVYLTGKSTGQLEVARQLAALAGDPPGFRFRQIRNKGEHCINHEFHCFPEVCRFLDGIEQRWTPAAFRSVLNQVSFNPSLEEVREAGRRETVCPYEITRSSLPFQDLLLGDYNYLFAPGSRGVILDTPGFDPGETLLLIDEAHNLPGRAAEALSCALDPRRLNATYHDLAASSAHPRLLHAWEQLLRLIDTLGPTESLAAAAEDDLADLAAEFARTAENHPPERHRLRPPAADDLQEVLRLAKDAGVPSFPRHGWVDTNGVVRLTCLDAADWIREVLQPFAATVLLSATLGPTERFARACGLGETTSIDASAPWKFGAYRTIIDTRADTRYERRRAAVPLTAATLARLAESLGPPVVGFFPSYAYAGLVLEQLSSHHPLHRAVLQPRGADLAGQAAFIEESLVLADILLLVLGSSFSEAVDGLGGRVRAALVAGPSYPEVNAIQRARLELRRGAGRETAFHETYRIPGLIKVNQALGRMVRAPGQEVAIVLHCRRFAEEACRSLLAPDLATDAIAVDDAGFEAWLAATASAQSSITQ